MKIISYSLLILVFYAFNYKTINYLFSLSEKSISFVQDIDCEEQDSESEKSGEKIGKDELKEISEYLLKKHNFVIIINELSVLRQDNFLFISSNYIKTVFLPPEAVS